MGRKDNLLEQIPFQNGQTRALKMAESCKQNRKLISGLMLPVFSLLAFLNGRKLACWQGVTISLSDFYQ